jgi:hypothetical protein
VKKKYATQSKWAGIVFTGTFIGVIWQFTHGGFQGNPLSKYDYFTIALIAACVISYWYTCWAYGAAKGYPLISIVLPVMSLFGLAVLFFLQDQDSMPATTETELPTSAPTES